MSEEEKYIKEQLNKTGIVTIENITLPTPLFISQNDYKCDGVFFKNCSFSSELKFFETNLKFGLQFYNTKFWHLSFVKCTGTGYNEYFNPNNECILLKDCEIRNDFSFELCKLERELRLIDSKVEKLNIVENIFSNLYFLRTSINNFSTIAHNECTNLDIRFEKSFINNSLRFEQNVIPSYVFMDSTFKSDIFIWGGTAKNGITFNGGVFEDTFKIHAVKSTGNLTFIDVNFKKSCEVLYNDTKHNASGGCPKIYILDSEFNNGVYINGKDDIFAESPIVEDITINISPNLKGNIEIMNFHVGILNMGGTNTSANIYLQDLLINQIKIKGLINNAGIIFLRVKASYKKWYYDKEQKQFRENALYIDSTNFGKAQFFNTDFGSFQTIVFHNNILTDISTSLMKWFTPDQLHVFNEKEYEKLLIEAKKSKNKHQYENASSSLDLSYCLNQELYRQLKFASQKQGDKPSALEFQRHEMNYYRKIVKLRKPRNWSEHLILWSNQSNDFGQNWIKALILLAACSFICFIPIGFLNSNELDYSTFASSLSDIAFNLKIIFWENLNNWLIIINPAHSLKDLNENFSHLSKWIYFWDFLSRIVVSYFIFQTISAFRKFNK
ncbi:MAG TPA: hypothetical protein PKK00_06255 [Bacteroidales bacterium]|nr:hypothetical protein [Bacteroidales bacterium]HPS16892.1 hypothetical protein [Bacteroidales bacterium]